MKRTEARELLMQLLFQMDAQADYTKAAQDKFVAENFKPDDEQMEYVHKMLMAYTANKDEVDQLIEASSVRWHINRMAKVDLAVLRLAVTEIKFLKSMDIPVSVAINEAVNIAKKYGAEESGKFVNGILGNLVK